MINSNSVKGQIQNQGSVSGEVKSGSPIFGTVMVGGSGGSKNAVLYVEQELTDEQIEQARKNIRVIGKDVSGMVFSPYVVDEDNNYEYIYDDPVEAADGAEIFNDYENNFATGAWSTAMGCKTQCVGNYSFANGWWTRADGQCAVASGLLSRASGHFTHAEGTRTLASINNAHSEGDMTQATGRQSHSEGQSTKSSGFCSHAEGSATVSSGYYSHSEGWGTTAKGKNQTAMGKYNIADTTSLLIVGKGSKATPSNALTLNSSGNLWVAGTVTSTGADYAEYFEWVDANPNEEDRIALVVTLEGDKIRLAQPGDDILGIVSGTALVLGDNAECEWKNKYLTDKYGRIQYEMVEEFAEIHHYDENLQLHAETVSTGMSPYPKLNPEFNPEMEYAKRSDRPEWAPIGMIGKLHVIDDGTCEVGSYATVASNGIVTTSTDRTNMRVMKRIAEDVVLVLLK